MYFDIIIVVNKMKKIIGIVPTSNYMLTDDSFADHYRYGNNYVKKIIENDAIPYFIPLCNDEVLFDCLRNIDGIIFPGGERVTKYSLQIMDYCYKHFIPVLGICLGMQTLGMFSVNLDNNKKIIEKVGNHWPLKINRNNEHMVVHKDYIDKDSLMHKIFKNDEIMVNSLHHNCIKEVGSKFRVSIKSEDGVIEGIEYIDNDRLMIGVQFHPELLPQFNDLFKYFISNCDKYGYKE